jgi:hypothetical protein
MWPEGRNHSDSQEIFMTRHHQKRFIWQGADMSQGRSNAENTWVKIEVEQACSDMLLLQHNLAHYQDTIKWPKDFVFAGAYFAVDAIDQPGGRFGDVRKMDLQTAANIAIIISGFGTLALAIVTVWQMRREWIPDIRIRIDTGMATRAIEHGLYGPTMRDAPTIIFTALNHGRREVTLRAFELWLENIEKLTLHNMLPDYIYEDGKKVHFTLPHVLLPGTKYSVFIYTEDISRALLRRDYSGELKLIGRFITSIGRVFNSEPYYFRVDE